jgi:YD repeat-containing protein
MNRLYQVFENGLLTVTYTYDANGNRATLAYPNGDTAEYQYNPANKLTLLTNKKGANILSQYAYTYYLNGNQESKTDLSGKTSYIYDGLERLSNVAEPGSVSTAYTYDDYNNRLKSTKTEGTTAITDYAYDKNCRLLTEVKVTGDVTDTTYYNYDNNGNQIYSSTETAKPIAEENAESFSAFVQGEAATDKITFNGYDGLNQLVKTITGDKAITYSYNGDGLRRSKTVNGVTTTHVWDGQDMALELNGSNVTGKYIRGINLIAAEDGAGARKYYLFNGHGDVVQLANTTGDGVKSYDYDAFGVEKNIDPNDVNVFRYCGEYWDKETGTVYYSGLIYWQRYRPIIS